MFGGNDAISERAMFDNTLQLAFGKLRVRAQLASYALDELDHVRSRIRLAESRNGLLSPNSYIVATYEIEQLQGNSDVI